MSNAKRKTQNAKIIKKASHFLLKFWPILAIFGLVIIFAFPYWAKGKVPFPADYLVNKFPPWQYYYGSPIKNAAMPDVLAQMYPFKHLAIDWWRQRIVPLWNPYNFAGNPFLANYQSAVFHPVNFLFFLLPEVDAWSLMILLQPLLAGLFCYLFCRQLKLSRLASFLSSISFMLGGFITVWMAYGTLAWALLWLPLILYLIEKNYERIRWWCFVLLSLCLAASFFSGHFQISVYVFLTSFGYLFFRFLVSKELKPFVIGFLALALGILLASPQTFPTYEFYQLSSRSKMVGVSEIVPWSYLPAMIAPDFYGNPTTRNDWFGHYAEWCSFVGVIPLLLAVYAVVAKKKKKVWFFLALTLSAFVLIHPSSFLKLIIKWRIPVLSSSAAARANSLLTFGMAVLAGFGLDRLRRDWKERKWFLTYLVSFLGLAVIGLLWGILLINRPFPANGVLIAKRNLILPSGMAMAFAGLVVVLGVLDHAFAAKKKMVKWAKLMGLSLMLLLSAFDLFRFAQKWMPFDSKRNIYPSLPVIEFLTKTLGYNRLFGFFGMELQNYYKIQGFGGYNPLFIQRYGELMAAVGSSDHKIHLPGGRGTNLARRSRYTVRMLDLLGGKYYLYALADGRNSWVFPFWEYPGKFRQVYGDKTYEVYENRDAFPRAFMTYDYQVQKEPQKIIDLIFSPKIDLRKTLVLEQEPSLAISQARVVKKQKVKISSYTPNRIDIEVQTDRPGLLFLSDNYYPGWQAFVDGRGVKIYRADYSFRAIAVPAGSHTASFLYRPHSFKLGMRVGFASLTILIGLALVLREKK